MKQIYPTPSYNGLELLKKECVECSATFWHCDENVIYCGNGICNNNQPYFTDKRDISVKKMLSQFYQYFNGEIVPRASCINKYTKTNVNFLCAGVDAYCMITAKGSSKLPRYSNRLFLSNNFCFRFMDKVNVESTGRHASGFFMLGLHYFEYQKFPENWKSVWINQLISYFVETLKIPLASIYVHADTWTDTVNCGPSMELFVNGIEVGNCVFTQNCCNKLQPMEHRYLDVGLGLQRIHQLISTKNCNYFKSVLHDHFRTLVLAINDGVFPSKIGVGYNIRKLIETLFISYPQDYTVTLNQVISNLKLMDVQLKPDIGEFTLKILNEEQQRCVNSNII